MIRSDVGAAQKFGARDIHLFTMGRRGMKVTALHNRVSQILKSIRFVVRVRKTSPKMIGRKSRVA